MCGNTMSVPLLTDAATVSGAERETAAVRVPAHPQQLPGQLGNWLEGAWENGGGSDEKGEAWRWGAG